MTKHTHGFLLLLGIVLLGGGIYVAFQSYQAKSWPTTTARVTESELRAPQNERYGVLGKPMHARPKKLAVQYEYRIGGKSYTNDRVTFGSRSGSSMVSLSGSPGALVELAKGKAVTVHYNPNDPSDSVIETELPLTVPFMMVLGVVICGVASCRLLNIVEEVDDAYLRDDLLDDIDYF